MWVGHIAPHEVWRLDPSSAKPTARIAVGAEVRAVGFGGGYAWVLAGTSLLRVDPATNEVTRTVQLKSPSGVGGPSVLVHLEDPFGHEPILPTSIGLGYWAVWAVRGQ